MKCIFEPPGILKDGFIEALIRCGFDNRLCGVGDRKLLIGIRGNERGDVIEYVHRHYGRYKVLVGGDSDEWGMGYGLSRYPLVIRRCDVYDIDRINVQGSMIEDRLSRFEYYLGVIGKFRVDIRAILLSRMLIDDIGKDVDARHRGCDILKYRGLSRSGGGFYIVGDVRDDMHSCCDILIIDERGNGTDGGWLWERRGIFGFLDKGTIGYFSLPSPDNGLDKCRAIIRLRDKFNIDIEYK